jgi:hypothetical protein
MTRLLAIVLLVAGCAGSPRALPTTAIAPPEPPPTTVPADPIAQAEIAFIGNPSQGEIRTKLNRAFSIYGLEATSDNYSRAGSSLVALGQRCAAIPVAGFPECGGQPIEPLALGWRPGRADAS